jgi:glucose-6-phosphate 1-dehydrogenase
MVSNKTLTKKEIAPLVSAALAPTIFVIFGITGDLAGSKLLPALLGLYVKKELPNRFAIVGVSRRHFSREELRQYLRDRMNIKPGQFFEENIKHFLDHISYVEGQFDSADLYKSLTDNLKSIDDKWGQCSNKLFHLSVPPVLYEGILRELSSSKLTLPCSDGTGWTRVLVEKPFGNDIKTAHDLDKLLGKLFKEDQIFRIDHYLAKEALQNISAFRFSNFLFEPLWNRQYIKHVHIKLLEKETLSLRGGFYDSTGALKDVGQNHLLIMLAIVAMDKPCDPNASDAMRRERARALSRLTAIPKRSMTENIIRGQYDGFKNEKGVKPDSSTETYFRIAAKINNRRWKGVPFYLEAGKAMAENRVEIDIYFKGDAEGKKNHENGIMGQNHQNILTFRIQPDEGIKIRFFVKKPGIGMETESKILKFNYADSPSFSSLPEAYERLIRDAIVGDQTLFASTDEIMASWKFITPILENWSKLPLVIYKKGAREV